MTHTFFCVLWVGHRPVPIRASHLADSLESHLKMIDPNLEENKTKTSIHIAGPSISDALTTDIVTSILLLLKDNHSTTLKKLTEHVKKNHDIQVSIGAIQKMLKTIDVTWKTVTPIPRKWNKAAFLQQQHDMF
ncbi:hypothetical protein VP01_1606g7 [Puccinia sorghi]|uniref:Uncharacterized protein n=1 Tax=Puccinia sorghi TaxID=27349 RepID=A0A0L6VH77_9BASI|nr:hypothetical protein VP01_1606g7 [Puccinia sorghi]